MNVQTYLRECQIPSRWHFFRMLSKTPPKLSIVETLDEYTSTTSYTYYNLLINACVRYDAINTSATFKKRNVYAASGTQDFTISEKPHETQFSQDIDTPSDDFYQVHQPNIAKSLQNHYLGSRRIMPKRPPHLHPKNLLKI